MNVDTLNLASNIIFKQPFERNLIKFIKESNSSLKINEIYFSKSLKRKVLLIGMNDEFTQFLFKIWKRGLKKNFEQDENGIGYVWISKNIFLKEMVK